MIFAAAVVALHVIAFAIGAIDAQLAHAVLPLIQCTVGLAALALPGVRRALLDTLARYWPAALAYAALVALAMQRAGLFGAGAAAGAQGARTDVWGLIGFALGALGIAGAALAAGRRFAQNALLAGAIALGALAVAQHLQAGRTLFAAPGETAVVFALFAALAAFATAEALGQRANRESGGKRRRTRAERIFLPAAGLGAALIGLALTSSLEITAALGLGLGLLALALALRERRRGMGALILGGLALAGAAAGVLGLILFRRAEDGALVDPAQFSGEHGLSFAIAALAWTALLIRLGLSADRRRRPSRGLALALGAGVVMLLAGPDATAPAAFATLALLIGMAAAHADVLAPTSPELRS